MFIRLLANGAAIVAKPGLIPVPATLSDDADFAAHRIRRGLTARTHVRNRCACLTFTGIQDPPDNQPEPRLTRAVWLVAVMGVGAVLYFAQDVLIPVAMAIFLALLLTPAVDRLQRLGLRRGFAVAVIMAVVL